MSHLQYTRRYVKGGIPFRGCRPGHRLDHDPAVADVGPAITARAHRLVKRALAFQYVHRECPLENRRRVATRFIPRSPAALSRRRRAAARRTGRTRRPRPRPRRPGRGPRRARGTRPRGRRAAPPPPASRAPAPRPPPPTPPPP